MTSELKLITVQSHPQHFEWTQNAQQAEGLDVSKHDESTVKPVIYLFPLVPVIMVVNKTPLYFNVKGCIGIPDCGHK